MKVLHFKYRALGPCETFIERQLRLFKDSDLIKAEFLYIRSTPKQRCCPIKSRKGWWAFISHFFSIKNLLPDLVHAHFGSNAILAMLLTWARGIPLVVSFYGHDVGSFPNQNFGMNKLLYGLLFRHSYRIIAMTETMKQQLIGLGCPENIIFNYYVGVDPIRPRNRRSDKLSNLLMVSSLRPKKNHRFVLQSLARLKSQGISLKLRIIGDGPEKPKLETLSRELNLENQISFLGHITDRETLSDHYNWGDLMLHPSCRDDRGDQEGLPSSVVEAFSSGIAVLLSDHAGMKETFGGVGIYVDAEDVSHLVKLMLNLYEKPIHLNHLESESRRFFDQNYALKDFLTPLKAIYM